LGIVHIGEITRINLYPVKSFAGRSVESSRIESYGLYGDRSHAFIDETKEGWDQYFTARQIPEMLGYTAELTGEGSERQFPEVKVTSPDGRMLKWDEDLLEEIQAYSKRKMTMLRYEPQTPDLLAVDTASILIVSDRSLRKLEDMWGKSLDERRFRANLILSLAESSINESDWIGKRLTAGSAELAIDSGCERCSMITIHPDSLERDSSLLRTVNKEMNLNFGMYASVVKKGEINVGDSVYLLG